MLSNINYINYYTRKAIYREAEHTSKQNSNGFFDSKLCAVYRIFPFLKIKQPKNER